MSYNGQTYYLQSDGNTWSTTTQYSSWNFNACSNSTQPCPIYNNINDGPYLIIQSQSSSDPTYIIGGVSSGSTLLSAPCYTEGACWNTNTTTGTLTTSFTVNGTTSEYAFCFNLSNQQTAVPESNNTAGYYCNFSFEINKL